MPSDYAAITKYNEEQLGKDTASRRSQVNMYSDFTHFIFEILQNADDYGARKIEFRLLPNELVIEYDGEPFKTKNVEAISYFEKSTSRNDLVKTGRFGLGFKSVFACTATPIIHSGNEHFKIYGLYRLQGVAPPRDFDFKNTRLCLPFNHESERPSYVENHVSAEVAFERISSKLQQLDITSLLFTRSIREIRRITRDEYRYCVREDIDAKEYTEELRGRKTTITDGEKRSIYLVFARPIFWNGESHKPVEIAFQLDNDRRIIKARAPLFVLFPTTLETHVGFLMNGPYRTPAHRETVAHDDAFNHFLVQETTKLLIGSLAILEQENLLTVDLLNTLPIRLDDFPRDYLFRPMAEAVRLALKEQPLLPADGGGFISGRHAKFAESADLRELLGSDQLKLLFGSSESLEWLSDEITPRKTPDLYGYIRQQRTLAVDEITPDFFARRITPDFLKQQSDKWMEKFYIYLSQHEPLWRTNGPLRNKEFIRLEDERHVKPFREDGSPYAYLPPAHETDFPIVKREIAENEQARAFLKKLGIQEIDVVAEVIEKVLPKYSVEHPPVLSDDEHLQDVAKIRLALRIDSQEKKRRLEKALRETPFIRAVNGVSGVQTFMKSDEIYIRSKDLEIYFEGNQDSWFLKPIYNEETVRCFEALGVSVRVGIVCHKPDYRGNVNICNYHGWHRRGLAGFDPDCMITSLEHALVHPSVERSSYVWNELALPNVQYIRGIVESSSRQSFDDSKREECISKMGRLLTDKAWLPDQNGEFHMPHELSLENLPESFCQDERLAKSLGMKSNEVAILAQKVGVELDDIELLKALKSRPDEYQRVKLLFASTNHRPAFPVRSPANPDRREEKIRDDYQNAPEKEYDRREKSERISRPNIDPATWLRDHYTNDQGQLICQICEQEMPFKKRNDEYYFEKVEIFKDCDREYAQLHLALCPVCAAKYQEFVKTDPNGEMQKTKSSILDGDSLSVPVCLEKDSTIRFVESHFNDLRTILREMFCIASSD